MSRADIRGFTLVELIAVVVISGIIAAIVAVFIAKPVGGYVDAVRRAELSDTADEAMHRVAREVRLALPNSLRVTTNNHVNFIEFIPTSGGGRYADDTIGGNILSFSNSADTSFDIVGAAPSAPAIAVNDFIVVSNLGPGYAPADAYLRDQAGCTAIPASPGCNIAKISAIANSTVTLDANPFAFQTLPVPSPNARFHVIPGGVRAVTLACPNAVAGATPGNFTRYWNYGFSPNQPTTFNAGGSILLATGATCTVEYAANATGRNGLLYLALTLTSGTEHITLFQQIHVDNAP